MAGGPTPYDEKVIRIGEMSERLLRIFDAAEIGDGALYNAVKQTEHDGMFGRQLLEAHVQLGEATAQLYGEPFGERARG